MRPANWSNVPRHGFWDALWARSQSGRLTLVAQTVDYDGNLRMVHASPPSVIVDLPGPDRTRVVVFGQMPDSRPWANRLGFAWDADAQQTADDQDKPGGAVSVRARMLTLPYWSIVLLGLPVPLGWLRAACRESRR